MTREKYDLVICLSHLGYDYKNEPTVVKNKKDKNVLVNQIGCYWLYLGRIDFHFYSQNNKTSYGSAMAV